MSAGNAAMLAASDIGTENGCRETGQIMCYQKRTVLLATDTKWAAACRDGCHRIRLIGFGILVESYGVSNASVTDPLGRSFGIAVRFGQRSYGGVADEQGDGR